MKRYHHTKTLVASKAESGDEFFFVCCAFLSTFSGAVLISCRQVSFCFNEKPLRDHEVKQESRGSAGVQELCRNWVSTEKGCAGSIKRDGPSRVSDRLTTLVWLSLAEPGLARRRRRTGSHKEKAASVPAQHCMPSLTIDWLWIIASSPLLLVPVLIVANVPTWIQACRGLTATDEASA